MSDPLDLVTVYRGANVTEAHLVMNLLLDEDIDARVTEENEPLAGLGITPPDVLVQRKDLERAKAVIAEYEERQVERVESGEALEDDYEADDEEEDTAE